MSEERANGKDKSISPKAIQDLNKFEGSKKSDTDEENIDVPESSI